MLKFNLYSLFIFLIYLNISNLQICTRTVTYTERVRVPETIEETQTFRTFSGAIKSMTRNKTRYVIQPVLRSRIRKGCCQGYTRNNHRCEPVCNFVCENSVCSAPDVCTCNTGYKPFTSSRCIPKCKNCDHGVCIAPDVCKCPTDYEISKNGTCQPICTNKCINGYCSAPNICSCNDGYYLVEEDNQSLAKCEPHCSTICKNGYCSAPEQCTCWDGYKMNNNGSCEPVCINGCENGICINPDTCVCMPNYKYNSNGQCEPECINGFRINSDGVREYCGCQEGYQLSESGNSCEPYCTNCKNGICQAPGKCICNMGYELTENNTCKPICTKECINGMCTEPETCQCYDGYKFSDIMAWYCVPICEPLCENGECIEPNVCKCLKNYKKFNETVCTPHCDPECINADCLEPMKCTCKNGYEVDGIKPHLCHAMCDNCEFGECIEPDVCKCYEGHEYNDVLQTCLYTTTFFEDIIYTTPNENYWDYSGYDSTILNDYDTNSTIENLTDDYDELIDYDSTTTTTDLITTTTDLITTNQNYDYDSTTEYDSIIEYDSTVAYDSLLSTTEIDSTTEYDSTIAYDSTVAYDSLLSTTEIDLTTTRNDLNFTDVDNICNMSCPNGKCINNKCECFEGYFFKNDTCNPQCPDECINSDCVEPEICKCWNGYTILDSFNHCYPICNLKTDGCENGNCIRPNICECGIDYILNPNNKFECIKYVPITISTLNDYDELAALPYVIVAILIICMVITLGIFCYKKCYRTKSYNTRETGKELAQNPEEKIELL